MSLFDAFGHFLEVLGQMPSDAPVPSATGSTVKAKELIAQLEALGSSEAIAKFLDDNGYSGYTGDATSCPVANFFRDKLGKTVSVSGEVITVTNGESESFNIEDSVISDFVNDFDSGCYPDLDDTYADDDDDEDEDDFDDDE